MSCEHNWSGMRPCPWCFDPVAIKEDSAYQAIVVERDDLLAKYSTLNKINDDYEIAYQRDIHRIEQLEASRDEWRLKCMRADDEANKNAQENAELLKDIAKLKKKLIAECICPTCQIHNHNKKVGEVGE